MDIPQPEPAWDAGGGPLAIGRMIVAFFRLAVTDPLVFFPMIVVAAALTVVLYVAFFRALPWRHDDR